MYYLFHTLVFLIQTNFSTKNIFIGLPNLCDLLLSCNQLTDITLPSNVGVASKLETLDLGFNNISELPVELDQLQGLRHLIVARNCLSMVPMRVCEMKLQCLDVSNNNVIKPPVDICELGIEEMRSYWHSIRLESYTECSKKVSRKGKRTLTKSVTTLSSNTAISDLSESTAGREDYVRYLMHSSSSMLTDRPAEEL